MADGNVRDEIAAELAAHSVRGNPPVCRCGWAGDVGDALGHIADGLAAIVERRERQAAAAELRGAAHRLDDGGDESIEVALGGAAYVHRVLCDRAYGLDGQP